MAMCKGRGRETRGAGRAVSLRHPRKFGPTSMGDFPVTQVDTANEVSSTSRRTAAAKATRKRERRKETGPWGAAIHSGGGAYLATTPSKSTVACPCLGRVHHLGDRCGLACGHNR
jgi:hypothetical protein